jgi:hypothetical protein
MVQGLIDKGFAYPAQGDVYFRVRKSKEYGKLSNRKLDEMQAGARIEVDDRKEDPIFVACGRIGEELSTRSILKRSVLVTVGPARFGLIGSSAGLQEIYAIINDLARKGFSLVLASSELEEVIKMSDRLLVLYEGRIKDELESARATEETVLTAIHR